MVERDEHNHTKWPVQALIDEYNTVQDLMSFPRPEHAYARLYARIGKVATELTARIETEGLQLMLTEEYGLMEMPDTVT